MRPNETPTMPKTLETPKFSSEQAEALWWENNQSLLLREFSGAAKDKTLARGAPARQGQTPTTTIRLDPVDIDLAKSQAELRGLRYQTYLKMLIHQALLMEANK